LYGLGLQSAIKQARNIKFEGDLLTADSFVDSDIAATKGAAEGMYLTQIWLDDAAFTWKYEAAFGNAKTSGTNLGYTALAYDAVMLVDAAAAQITQGGEKITTTSLLARLPNFSFDGVLGATKVSRDRTVERREKVLQVKNDSYTEVIR
jgi:ABC-type branched-subunit amino acid transport system substrate-binding protein